MRSRTLIALAAAFLGAAPAALADSKMAVSGGVLYFRSEDAGVANRLTIDRDGRGRAHFVDEADPAGISYPTPPCSPGRVNDSGNAVEVFCTREGYTRIAIQSGPGEDHVTSTIADLGLLAEGGVGADVLVTGTGSDILAGGQGDDVLRPGDGNDRVDGGEGADNVDAGAGDDVVLVADGEVDTVDCGAGADSATIDTGDRVLNCETVTARGTASAAPAADRTRPRVQVGGSTSQRIGLRRRRVTVAVTVDEPARIDVSGFVDAGGLDAPLTPARGRVRVAGAGTTVRVTLSRAVVRRALRDLRRGGKPVVHLTISAVDASGNTSRARRLRIALRR